jgi:hypothetical protein
MVYVDKYTLQLSGPLIKESANRHPIKSAFNDRNTATRGKINTGRWQQEFFRSGLSKEQVEIKIEEALLEVEAKKKDREKPRNRVAYLRRQCSITKNNLKYSPPNTKAAQLSEFKEKQHSLRLEEQHFQEVDLAWEEAKKELNYWNRLLTGAKVKDKDMDEDKNNDNSNKKESTSHITAPTWHLPCAEDIPQHLDLRDIFANHRTKSPSNRTRIVATWAEDPGVKTLSENVFLTVEGIEESVNRFHVLQGMLLNIKQQTGIHVSRLGYNKGD